LDVLVLGGYSNRGILNMDSQSFDQPRDDPFLGFPSETRILETQEVDPPFLRTPTLGDEQRSIASLTNQGPSRRVGVWFVAMVSVVTGVVAGFAAGYAFGHRPIVPAAAVTPLGTSSGNSQTPREGRSTEAAPGPNVVASDPPTNPSAVSVPSTQSSLERPSINRRRVSAVVPTVGRGGAIEIVSHPRDAQVLLDGNAIGRAPVSIPEVAEGTHEVRIELAGFNPWVTSVRVKDGSRTRVGASLQVEGLK
jgi:PEGA domain